MARNPDSIFISHNKTSLRSGDVPISLLKFILKNSILLLLLNPFVSKGQDSMLTLNQAIEQSLKNNYDINIASNQRMEAANNNTPGNAGMLPQVNLNASYLKSITNIKQSYTSGLEVNKNQVGANITNVNVALSWTIFNGQKMFATREKLGELSARGEVILRQNMENTIQSVTTSYYLIVKAKQLLKATREEITYADERVKISERRLNNGSGSKLELLQARTDLNAARSLELNQKSAITEAMTSLNVLLARDAASIYEVEDTIIISFHSTPEELNKQASEKNSSILIFQRNMHISELGLKEIRSQRMPTIALAGNYLFNKAKNEAGFVLFNQNLGYNYGITATMPLFNGFIINSQVKNAKLEILNAKLEYDQVKNTLNADLYNALHQFNDNVEMLKLEEENISMSRELLKIAQERYRVGLSSGIELRDAQRTFEESNSRLVNARYNAKISETDLRRLSGELIK